jgi:hypothetical protein
MGKKLKVGSWKLPKVGWRLQARLQTFKSQLIGEREKKEVNILHQNKS